MSSDINYEKRKTKMISASTRFVLYLVTLLLLAVSSAKVLEDHDSGLFEGTNYDAAISHESRIGMRPKSKMVQTQMAEVRAKPLMQKSAASAMNKADYAQEDEEERGGESLGSVFRKSLDKTMGELPNKTPVQRMLVHNGQMSLLTKAQEGKSTAKKIEDFIFTEGGYVESKSANTETYYKYVNSMTKTEYGRRVEKSRITMDLVLRIPSDKFHEFMTALQDMVGADRVQNLSTNSRDVTDSYVDASSRAETLNASREAMQVLLEKADSVKEVMEIQRELGRLTQDYESFKSRAISLKNQSNLSTLHLNLVEDKEPDDKREPRDDNVPSRFSPMRTAQKAFADVASIFSVMLEIVVYASVLALAFAIPCLLGYALFGSCLKKQAARASSCLG